MERMTLQRKVICNAFERVAQPMSVPEAHEAACEQLPKLGIATVYRAINALVEQGWLAPVEMPGDATRYELADIGHHHHFQCRDCGKVFDVSGCPGDLKKMLPKGFELESHEIILYGRCADCRVG